jgi:hypothetical protein
MHPLAGDLTQMSDEELLKKLNELYDKIRASYRFSDPTIIQQLYMLLDSYKNEQGRRAQVAQEKFAQNNKKLVDRIDIE